MSEKVHDLTTSDSKQQNGSQANEGTVTKICNPTVDYTGDLDQFTAARYVIEVCHKLESYVLTTATALTYFHTFYQHANFEEYDPFTIGCTCIHLASKVVDDDIRIRDIINVGLSCMKRESQPLMLEPYFTLRDSLTQAELLVMRVLGFKLKIELPHKFILHYLRALEDWVGKDALSSIPFNETAWQFLQDAYHNELVIKHSPELLAATCIHMALEVYGVTVPHDLTTPWYSVLHEDCTKANVAELTLKLFELYHKDKELKIL